MDTKLERRHSLRLRHRAVPAGRKGYSTEQLKAAGMTTEEADSFEMAKKDANKYSQMTSANRRARASKKPVPFSEEVLKEHRPGEAVYRRWLNLVDALMSGDEERIRKTRAVVQQGYRPALYSDEQLRRVYKNDAKVERYKELRPLAVEWRRITDAARAAGQPLREEDFTPRQRQLDAALYEYQLMAREVREGLQKHQPDGLPLQRGTRKYKDSELKRLLDVESIADFVKARRLSLDYSLRWKEAAKMNSDPPADTIRGQMSSTKFNELLEGKRLYREMLEILRQAQEAAKRGQNPSTESIRLEGKGKLFTGEEEQQIKRVLNVKEIEELVDGLRSERDLKRAQISNEAAQRERRRPLVTPRELEELQQKINRYRALRQKVDEHHQQGPSAGAGPLDAKRATQPKQPKQPDDGPDETTESSSSTNPPQNLKYPTQDASTQQRKHRSDSRASKERSTDQFHPSSINPSSLMDQVTARLDQFGTSWQNSHRLTNVPFQWPPSPFRSPGGSPVRNIPRLFPPAGIKAPLPI